MDGKYADGSYCPQKEIGMKEQKKKKKWSIRYIPTPESTVAVKHLAEEMGVSLTTAKLLYTRGLCTAEQATVFLKQTETSLHDPFMLKDIELAVARILLALEKGEKIAIVGPTGGGKTTIVNILMRFYDSKSGKVLVDGKDITAMSRNDVREMFGMVLQDTMLFSGSVYDNIAYGKHAATIDEVMEAAKKAHIDSFIDALPNGYDTEINEDSTNISAGQKQLLTIARAYLSDRPILILDEATSNVDTRTELLIQQTMDELMRGRTAFVIAHRLSTIENADTILVVDNGHIVEQGKHGELFMQNGLYSKIYRSQYPKGQKNDLIASCSTAPHYT